MCKVPSVTCLLGACVLWLRAGVPAGDRGRGQCGPGAVDPASNSSKGAGTPTTLGTHLHTPPEK